MHGKSGLGFASQAELCAAPSGAWQPRSSVTKSSLNIQSLCWSWVLSIFLWISSTFYSCLLHPATKRTTTGVLGMHPLCSWFTPQKNSWNDPHSSSCHCSAENREEGNFRSFVTMLTYTVHMWTNSKLSNFSLLFCLVFFICIYLLPNTEFLRPRNT